jgi:hypothetical protein
VVTFASSVRGYLKLPVFAPDEDSGPLVKALLDSAPGKKLIAYREWRTLEEFVHIFSEVTSLPARYVTLPAGQPDIPLPGGLKEELDDNWAMFNEFGYEIHDDPDVIHPNQVCRSVYDRVGIFANVATVGSKSKAGHCSRLDSKARLELRHNFVRGRRGRLETRASSGVMDLNADASDISIQIRISSQFLI